jgi:hypothetical protein
MKNRQHLPFLRESEYNNRQLQGTLSTLGARCEAVISIGTRLCANSHSPPLKVGAARVYVTSRAYLMSSRFANWQSAFAKKCIVHPRHGAASLVSHYRGQAFMLRQEVSFKSARLGCNIYNCTQGEWENFAKGTCTPRQREGGGRNAVRGRQVG